MSLNIVCKNKQANKIKNSVCDTVLKIHWATLQKKKEKHDTPTFKYKYCVMVIKNDIYIYYFCIFTAVWGWTNILNFCYIETTLRATGNCSSVV